jgi:hypothetical protein
MMTTTSRTGTDDVGGEARRTDSPRPVRYGSVGSHGASQALTWEALQEDDKENERRRQEREALRAREDRARYD